MKKIIAAIMSFGFLGAATATADTRVLTDPETMTAPIYCDAKGENCTSPGQIEKADLDIDDATIEWLDGTQTALGGPHICVNIPFVGKKCFKIELPLAPGDATGGDQGVDDIIIDDADMDFLFNSLASANCEHCKQEDGHAQMQCRQDCEEHHEKNKADASGETLPPTMMARIQCRKGRCTSPGEEDKNKLDLHEIDGDGNDSILIEDAEARHFFDLASGASCTAEGCTSSDEGARGADAGSILHGTMVAQPTGHGGGLGGPSGGTSGGGGSSSPAPESGGGSEVDPWYCADRCQHEHEDNYQSCLDACEEEQKQSAETKPVTMIAEGGCYDNGSGGQTCHGEDGSVQESDAGGVIQQTQFASVRIGDPQPVCGTDAWACFNGTDDDSPAIRDIGIFSVFASK